MPGDPKARAVGQQGLLVVMAGEECKVTEMVPRPYFLPYAQGVLP